MQRYEKYKDSGVAWIGEIPENWEVKRLKYCLRAKITDGPHETPEFLSDGIPFLSVDGIQNGELVFDGCRKISKEDFNRYQEKCKIELHDLLMGKAASIGKIAQVKTKKIFTIWSPLALIKPSLKILNSTFLEYFLKSEYAQYNLVQLSTFNTQRNISMQDIPKLILVIPNIIEQKKISNFLDKKTKEIDTLIDQKEQLLKLYEEEKRAIINRAVTKGIDADVVMKDSGIIKIKEIPKSWKITKFRFLFDLSKGLNITKKNLKSNGIPCINYGEIHSKYGFEIIPERDNLKCVEKDYLETASKALLQRGDFVFADTSEDIEGSGNFTHLHSDKNIFAGYHTVIARLKLDVNYRYIAYFIESISFRNQIQEQVKGVKVYSITNTILKDIFILLPLKEEQNKIVEFIENELSRINRKIQKTKDIITLQKEYRTALISEVVTGKIKVTEEEV